MPGSCYPVQIQISQCSRSICRTDIKPFRRTPATGKIIITPIISDHQQLIGRGCRKSKHRDYCRKRVDVQLSGCTIFRNEISCIVGRCLIRFPKRQNQYPVDRKSCISRRTTHDPIPLYFKTNRNPFFQGEFGNIIC